MRINYLLVWLAAFTILSACTQERHFINDPDYLSVVEKDFETKLEALANEELFSIFQSDMSLEEREAMMFLYAYMPIGDVADYDGQFYLNNVRKTFQIREEMPWGKTIPEEVFRHFVLPIRVNNENMDDSRSVFYDELKDRVKGLSLYDAVLEVNHWCHEKVIYTPSDARTTSPLASVLTAYGRCGEESVFTTAALRAVGIPARQVYTPRWAHTDDNHAWVEAWVDGKWYFMGACEPEPVLNLGWFNEPASRGLLMHSKVFGKYFGPGETMEMTSAYTEINVIDNYAPSATASITVQDAQGKVVPDATVEFKIYNYADFVTVATKATDENGKTSLTAGKGDMMAWVTKDGRFGYAKISFGKDDHVTIVLDKVPGEADDFQMDIIPPAANASIVKVTPEQREENDRRMREEDDIRNAYVATFYTEDKAKAFAKELGADEKAIIDVMIGSRGNWKEIEKFLRENYKSNKNALALLQVISAKDLRDTPAHVLTDHLANTPDTGNKLYADYQLNPRVSNELLTPFRSFFRDNMAEAEQMKSNPQLLVDWVKNNIRIDNSLNPQRIPIMPVGVWKARVADTGSRNVFFVAMARSLEIPARIESVARKVQYHNGSAWVDVDFETGSTVVADQGRLSFSYKPTKTFDDLRYGSHFSVSRVLDNGTLQRLNLRANANVDMGGGSTLSAIMRNPVSVDEGHYMVLTGTRLANGGVLADVKFFDITKNKDNKVALAMRESSDDITVIGSFNSESRYKHVASGEEQSILQTTGRGYFVIAILGARQEPTNHAMRDIAAVKDKLEQWGRGMVMLFPDEQGYSNFDPKEFGPLPNTITFGIDTDGKIQEEIVKNMKLSNPNSLPIFIIADTFNRVVFVSQGYTIGLGDQLMKVINKL